MFLAEAAEHTSAAPTWRQARRYHLGKALADWPVALVAVSSAVIFAVLWPYSIPWALAVSGVPLAITIYLGSRIARGRSMARLTIRALGRLPEAAGLTQSGHAQAVADLATAMAKLDGFVGVQLAELEIAAELHDIGLLATAHESVRAGGFSSADVATWGADIMAESKTLRPAAAIVSQSHEPFRVPGARPGSRP